jgi:hypothetical protein
MNGMDLSGKPGIVHPMAAAEPRHPPALGHVAGDDRTPASKPYDTFRRPVRGGKARLLAVGPSSPWDCRPRRGCRRTRRRSPP